MKIRDVLLPDFMEEIRSHFGIASEDVFDEPVTEDMQIIPAALRPGDAFQFYALPLYVLARLTFPGLVVETGTQNGASAQGILCALKRNAHGRLISIDAGNDSSDGTHAFTLDGIPGKHIPDHLRDRWELIIGFTQNKLEPAIDGEFVDLFFHDSDHSRAVVEYEFETVARHARSGSIVSLHDHYGQWDYERILAGWTPICGQSRPQVLEVQGVYQNVIRAWRKP